MSLNDQPHASWAEIYDIVYQGSFGALYERMTELTVDLLLNEVPPPAKVVDFGAGTGRLAVPLSQKGYSVTAVEPCQEMLVELRSKDPDHAITTVCEKMQDYCGNGDFDAALCVFTVILYLIDEESLKRALNAAYGALRPGGVLLLDIPSEAVFRSYSAQGPSFERTVTVTLQRDSIYNYREEVQILENGEETKRYVDEFPIRHWPVGQVVGFLEEIGFVFQRDLRSEFSNTGSAYFLYQKASRTAN